MEGIEILFAERERDDNDKNNVMTEEIGVDI